MARLFFALWPDDKTRQQINDVIEALPAKVGRRVTPENIHITLAFLGSVRDEVTECLQDQAKIIRADGFKLSLDNLGWWRKPQTIWLAPSFIPDELTDLVIQIHKVANSCGIKLENRPYKPHITLIRKAKQEISENSFETLNWNVDSFILVQSVTHPEGVSYTIRNTWRLK
jgi:2'-5' RNA ligase